MVVIPSEAVVREANDCAVEGSRAPQVTTAIQGILPALISSTERMPLCSHLITHVGIVRLRDGFAFALNLIGAAKAGVEGGNNLADCEQGK